jgi:superfamily II DNA/RNA helicase
VVVQWKLPGSTALFVQRAGRAARRWGRIGLAVLLVERSAYEVDLKALDEEAEAQSVEGKKAAGKTKGKGTKKTKGGKTYADAAGVNRGTYGGQSDTIFARVEPSAGFKGKDEGLYVLVQTSLCRRKVLHKVYDNRTTTRE